MQILPLTLKHDGFNFRQIIRTEKSALYSQYRGERLIGYEVIRIQTHKAHIWPGGAIAEAGEHYPNSGQWGVAGFTFKSLDAAHVCMALLTQQAVEVPHAS